MAREFCTVFLCKRCFILSARRVECCGFAKSFFDCKWHGILSCGFYEISLAIFISSSMAWLESSFVIYVSPPTCLMFHFFDVCLGGLNPFWCDQKLMERSAALRNKKILKQLKTLKATSIAIK